MQSQTAQKESGFIEKQAEAEIMQTDEPITAETITAESITEENPVERFEITEGIIEEPTPEPTPELTPEPASEPTPEITPEPYVSLEPQQIGLDPSWEFAANSAINSGAATLYRAQENRKDIVIGVNAGHGTAGGESARTYCHPDGTPKVTGGSTAEGSITATAVSSGAAFYDGTPENQITLRVAQILKELLLNNGYDVLMIRDGDDVQLDNVARTVICNNTANCHISLHYDGDGLDYDKGCFYMSVPDALKSMYPVSEIWPEDNRLGDCLIAGLANQGCTIFEGGSMQMDLTQTSYSRIPSVDIELGNMASDHSEESLETLAQGLLAGIDMFFLP